MFYLRVFFWTYISFSYVVECPVTLPYAVTYKLFLYRSKIFLFSVRQISNDHEEIEAIIIQLNSLYVYKNVTISGHRLFRISVLCIARSVFKHPFKAKYIILHLTKCHLL